MFDFFRRHLRDPETGECIPDEEEKPGESPAEAEKGMFQAVKAVLKDALDAMRKEIMAEAKTMMQQELKKLQSEFAGGLRKELGLSTDPQVTKTEMDRAIRKAVLDLKMDNKRTPGSELTKGPEGTGQPQHPVDTLLKEYQGEAA